jgi:NAD(P)-dependent dehydrogenase (short-subunit alcohol dehydrogenase family)
MQQDFNGKVVLITGGTSGIGLAAANRFRLLGANVVVMGRSVIRGDAAIQFLISTPGAGIDFFASDVAIVADCQYVVDQVIKLYHRLDILINSAGCYLEESISEMNEEKFDQLMAVNVKGTYFMSQTAVPWLKQTRGNIVNVSSDAGLNGNILCTAYCASKGAVTVFSKALALEMAPQGVRVNCVCPGDIDTPLLERQVAAQLDPDVYRREMAEVYPIGRIGTANEVANVITFLASEAASFVTGAVWSVDGGLTAI